MYIKFEKSQWNLYDTENKIVYVQKMWETYYHHW